MAEVTNTYRILFRKPQGNIPLSVDGTSQKQGVKVKEWRELAPRIKWWVSMNMVKAGNFLSKGTLFKEGPIVRIQSVRETGPIANTHVAVCIAINIIRVPNKYVQKTLCTCVCPTHGGHCLLVPIPSSLLHCEEWI